MKLTEFQKRLCNAVQTGLRVCAQPFGELAERLGSEEQSVIENLNALQKQGWIKHIRVLINYKALGRKSTLVTAHIESEQLSQVTEKINSLTAVSHNYLRKHYYNLWFTLQGESEEQLQAQIDKLSKKIGAKFYNFPAVKTYKLDTRFDIAGNREFMEAPLPLPSEKKIELSNQQIRIINQLQKPLPVASRPFEKVTEAEISEIHKLSEKRVIRRIAGVANYRKLGFTENVMLVLKCGDSQIDTIAQRITKFEQISHCYHRKSCKGFDYNLFAMLHGKNREEINRVISKITTQPGVKSYQILPTATELKKQPARNH